MNNLESFLYDDDSFSFSPSKPVEKASKKSTSFDDSFSLDDYEAPAPEEKTEEESGWSSFFRTLYQIPSGIAQALTYPLDIMQTVGSADAREYVNDIDDYVEELKKMYPNAFEGKEDYKFDKKLYAEALEQAENLFPTQGNIERGIEEETGLPLTPKNNLQKGIKFAATAGKLAPQGGTLRPLSFSIPRPLQGLGVEAAREALLATGMPEPISDLLSFAVLKMPPKEGGSLSFGKQKPSGIYKRGYENINKPTKVSERKLGQINEKVESDFHRVSQEIIAESPVGETAKNLAENPQYKQESRELLNKSQEVADTLSKPVSSKDLKKQIALEAKSEFKGYREGEADKSFSTHIKDVIENIQGENVSASDLVKQYRKNNADLAEYFEPGKSKAFNRGKRDALLTENRAIAKVIEEKYPDTELPEIFKDGNERWMKIRDAETIDQFVDDIFKKGENRTLNHKEMKEFFDDPNYRRIFQRSLGQEGYKKFETLMGDMLTTEKPYKMLRVAEKKGFEDLYKTAAAYFINPIAGAAKTGSEITKNTYRWLMNSMLDSPQIGVTWKEGVKALKKGDFKTAEVKFNALEAKRIETLKKFNEKNTATETKKRPKLSHKDEGVKSAVERSEGSTEHKSEKAATEKPPEKIIDLSGMGEGMMHGLYEGVFKALKENKDTFAGIKDPLIQAAKPAYEAGQIKSVEDLKKFAKFYSSKKSIKKS